MGPRKVEVVVMVAMSVALLLSPVASRSTSKSCTDGDSRCTRLAGLGSCDSNPTYMTSLCPLSCNLCSTTTTDASTASTTTTPTASTTTTPTASTTTTPTASTTTTPTASTTTTTTTTTTISQPDTTPPSLQRFSDTPTSKTATTIMPRRSIINPDFECGGLPSAARRRTTRQAADQEQLFEDPPFDVMTPAAEGGEEPVSHAICGASPISDRILLTAAFCVLDPDNPVTSVRLGDIDLAQENENNSLPADYAIVEIFLTDTFNINERYDDIALLKTDRKIEFGDFVFPYCISASPPALDTPVIAAGFGQINETHKSTQLMEGALRVLPLAQCEEAYLELEEQRLREAYPALLQGKPGLLCAGDERSGVCRGDEGGPLFREDEAGRRYLEGIISFTGSVCGDGVLPGLFTAVGDYVDFIDDTIYGQEQP